MSESTVATAPVQTQSQTQSSPVGAPHWPEPMRVGTSLQNSGNAAIPLKDPDGDPACATSSSQTIQSAVTISNGVFHWLSAAVMRHLDRLQADLLEKDQPPVVDSIMSAVLRIAIAGATGSASEALAAMISNAGPVKELFKSSIRSGLNEGIAAGMTAFSTQRSAGSVRAFIEAQKAGLAKAYMQAANNWASGGSHHICTEQQANALMQACTPDLVEAAGDSQYQGCRDAWIAYLAQARFGSRQMTAIDENGGEVVVDHSTELTSTDEREEKTKSGMGKFDVERGPEEPMGPMGVASGVLMVVAELPNIVDIGGGAQGMDGRPTITAAYLNGVNNLIRDQFVGKPLSEAKVPRVVICKVDGDHDDFEVRVNESGISFGRTRSSWLRARGLVGHPENLGNDDLTLRDIGQKLLLAELVPTSFRKGTFE